MKNIPIVFLSTFLSFAVNAGKQNLNEIQSAVSDDNIKSIKLASNEHSSEFVIFVKDSVKKHIHKEHTETLYVLEGKAQMWFGKKLITISEGDYIKVPPMTIHGVKSVMSDKPLKVLSIQAPEFLGKDRHFVEAM